MPSAVAFEEKMRAKQGKPISIIPTSTQRPNPANQQSRQTLGAFVRSAGNTTPPTTSEKRQQEETKRDNAVPEQVFLKCCDCSCVFHQLIFVFVHVCAAVCRL